MLFYILRKRYVNKLYVSKMYRHTVFQDPMLNGVSATSTS